MEVHMVNRLMALLGMAVVMVAIAAAMLAGAASAAADTDSGSDSDGAKTSSSEPGTNATSSEAGSHNPKVESEGAEQKPTEQTGSAPTKDDNSGSSDEDSSGQIPETSGSAVQSRADDTSHPATKTNKTHTDKRNSSRPDPNASAPAASDETAVSTGKSATTATPSQAPAKSEPASSAAPAAASAESLEPARTAVTQAPEMTTAVAARSTVGVTEQAVASRAPTVIDFVGSIVLNVVMGLIHTFDGAPVLPAGSNVTVRTSTLTIPVAGGRTVEADWYFPNDGETPTRLIYLQHGLGASGPMYSYTAAALAEQTHSIVVAPSLTSNFFDADAAWLGGTPMQQAVADLFVGDRAALTESASAAAGYEVTLPTRFVLVGHSLGGTLVMGAAGDMVDNGAIDDLAGVLLLDSVDVNNTVPTALQKLTGVNYRPVLNISSERYVWNMDGKVSDELEAARPGFFNGVMLVGGRHIDALQGGNPLIQISQYLIAGFSQPQNIEAVKTLAVGWVNDMFAGTHDGIYGAPQQNIQIDTSAGTATAVVLPFTSTQSVRATPLDGVLRVVLNFLSQNLFVYEPLGGQSNAQLFRVV
jgi:pimeloyl-ACP methyl ester carboxylesterase